MFKSPEFEQAEAHFAARLHESEFQRHHPEWSAAAEPNAHVHPLFASILNSAALPFRARVGQRRSFASSASMVAYERGFTAYPNQPWGLPDGPAMQGYLDAEHAHAIALAEQSERRDSDFAELL